MKEEAGQFDKDRHLESATKVLSSRECAASVAGVAGPTPQVLQVLQPIKDPSSLEAHSTQDVDTDAGNGKDDVGKSSESNCSSSESNCRSSESNRRSSEGNCRSSDACDGPVSATPVVFNTHEHLSTREALKTQGPLKASSKRHEALKATPVFLNTHEPFCLVTVGVQGGGKSHTVRPSACVFLLLYLIYY